MALTTKSTSGWVATRTVPGAPYTTSTSVSPRPACRSLAWSAWAAASSAGDRPRATIHDFHLVLAMAGLPQLVLERLRGGLVRQRHHSWLPSHRLLKGEF